MKPFFLGAFAIAAGLSAWNGIRPQSPALDPLVVSSVPEQERYSLVVAGEAENCVIAVTALQTASRTMALGPDCAQAAPVLAGSRLWMEREDGSVAFVDDRGKVTAEFAAGDGAAFESYAPRQPPMLLRSM